MRCWSPLPRRICLVDECWQATVAAVRNVSDGVNAIAWAFDWKRGDNVVPTGDAEHPNNIYPWLRAA